MTLYLVFLRPLGLRLEVIPFAPNDYYEIEGYYDVDDYENGLNFYTMGNTRADFEAYVALFSEYELTDTYTDDYGDTWYTYEKGNIIVDLAYYNYDGEDWIDVFVYVDSASSGGSDDGNDSTGYANQDFSAEDKQLFLQYIGEVIPFAPNDYYEIEGYYDVDDYENGLNFYTMGNTRADFEAYIALFSEYELTDTYTDDYGDTWYTYEKGNIIIDLAYYNYEGEDWIDVFVYVDGTTGDGTVGGGGDAADVDIITNNGKGLPADSDGIYDVDFTKAQNVKDVTDQGYYIDGCPTVGKPAVLVIPVDFSDATAASEGYTTEKIKDIFMGEAGPADYYTVDEYYYISSYGKLDLDITVLDYWFRPANASSYYKTATMTVDGEEVMIGDQLILDEALAALAEVMDLSDFDSDGNGIIDAVVLINSLDIDSDSDFNWAYRYWNMYTDDEGYYYEYDGVSANDYVWASYQFIHESEDKYGNITYSDTTVMNSYTYIHEFAHILGVDDYYDTATGGSVMGGYDVMDAMPGDHNAYTKFNLGWITESRLIVADDEVSVWLGDFTQTGETVIIANNWDEALGAYQEYYVIVYYTNNGLNSGEYGYFDESGIVVYHVNASLYREEYDGELYYDVYNNNTSARSEYGTENNLIEFVLTTDGGYVFEVGDSLPEVIDDSGSALAYTFTVGTEKDGEIEIVFSKNA